MYAQSSNDRRHTAAISTVADLLRAGDELWISTQVLREYFAVMSKSSLMRPAVPAPSLLADMLRFETRFRLAEESKAVFNNLKTLLQTFSVGGRQIYDANIVATMQTYGITHLLTHNTADFARFASIVQIIPLVP